MRSVLLGLAGGGVILALSGDALASPPLANTCYDVGFTCLNAGAAGNQPGTCVAASCVDLLDASYACGVCEPADAGANDGGQHGAVDAGSADGSTADSEAPGLDAASGDGADVGDAAMDAAPSEGDSSTGAAEAGGGVFPGSEGGSPSSGDEPDAGSPAPTMPGCAAAPSSHMPTGSALLALGVAGVVRARRRRRGSILVQ